MRRHSSSSSVSTQVQQLIGGQLKGIGSSMKELVSSSANVGANLVDGMSAVADGITDGVLKVADGITDGVSKVADVVGNGVAQLVSDDVTKVVDGISDSIVGLALAPVGVWKQWQQGAPRQRSFMTMGKESGREHAELLIQSIKDFEEFANLHDVAMPRCRVLRGRMMGRVLEGGRIEAIEQMRAADQLAYKRSA